MGTYTWEGKHKPKELTPELMAEARVAAQAFDYQQGNGMTPIAFDHNFQFDAFQTFSV